MATSVRIDARRVERLAATGVSVVDLCAALGVGRTAFMRRKNLDQRVAAAYRRGRLRYAESQGKQLVETGGKCVVARARTSDTAGLDRPLTECIMDMVHARGVVTWGMLMRLRVGRRAVTEDELGAALITLLLDQRRLERGEQAEERVYRLRRKAA